MINFHDSSSSSLGILINVTFLLLLLLLPAIACSECTCDLSSQESQQQEKAQALNYKLASIASILVSGAFGVSLPFLATKFPILRPENDMFFLIKAFTAGVILSTGFIHILPEAFHDLTSPCLHQNPWRNFPFPGFVAMISTIGTLMADSFATGYYKRLHFNKNKQVNMDEESAEEDEHSSHLHVHTHATHGHAHGGSSLTQDLGLPELIRRRIISQVLELGIVVHSVVIGVSLGASQNPETIKPLLVALSFHQFFEGMGLGGCIYEAKFKSRSRAIMATFFSVTTPIGIGIGIGISSVYKEKSPTSLIVEGILNSASAGILIYMALVDLLAADFMNPRLQNNIRIHLGANVSLLLGAASMSILAKWA